MMRYRARQASGLCPTCGGPREGELKLCADCRLYHCGDAKRRRDRFVASGLCVRCGCARDRPHRVTCVRCIDALEVIRVRHLDKKRAVGP